MKYNVLTILLVVLGLAAIQGCDILYARAVYGDWTCGLPGVHCRKFVK